LMQGALILPMAWMIPSAAAETQARRQQVTAAIAAVFGPNRTVRAGKVQVRVPAISENGYSVPVAVEVDSPMTRDDHVRQIAVVSEANPLAVIAQFELGPQAALARVNTRVRLADSQRVYAVAEMNNGTLWTGYGHSIVTLAACVI
jgi:sulfur-oxidizing protein SoxY